MRKVEKVQTVQDDYLDRGDLISTHPAFGQIELSKTNHSGLQKLYGSALGYHPHTISLTIRHSKRIHNLKSDSYFSGDEMIRVELSAAQFADMLTNMQMYGGVPCTIRRYNGKGIPEIDDEDKIEVDRIRDTFNQEMKNNSNKLREYTKELDSILSKKSINKADKNRIRRMLESVSRFFWDHSTFAMDMFGEAAEKITTQSKKEIESFYNTVVKKTGIKAINDIANKNKPLELAMFTEDNND